MMPEPESPFAVARRHADSEIARLTVAGAPPEALAAWRQHRAYLAAHTPTAAYSPFPTPNEVAAAERAEEPWIHVAAELERLAVCAAAHADEAQTAQGLQFAARVVRDNAPWGSRSTRGAA